MKKSLLVVLLAFAPNLAGAASAADSKHSVYCEKFADLAEKVAHDRDRGVPYKREIADFKQAKKNVPEFAKLNYPLEELIEFLYFQAPKLSPGAASQIQYAACMRH